jgi:prepilin-type N-terminal cleavage/methylation domain-containing protein
MKACRGFTLVELAMVLFVVSLLLGGLLVPLATQIEARQRSDAEVQLDKIREALVGFAIINGRLPCHTTVSDPASINYGLEDPAPCNPSTSTAGWTGDGILPWKTLGLNNALDPWGVQRTVTADAWTGYWRYRVQGSFANTFTLNTNPATNKLCVLDAGGNLLNSTSENPIAIIYSTGANQAADSLNLTYEATSTSTDCVNNTPITYQGGSASLNFDDITIWLTRPLLFNRLVSAGVLP